MLRPAPRVRPETQISIRRRRPTEVVELTEKSEPEFRAFIDDFERDPLFLALRERGHISKIGLHGRIPKDRYDAYADVEVIRLIREHGISDVAGWFDDLSRVDAVRNPHAYAPKYRVDAAVIRRVARYLRRLDHDDDMAETSFLPDWDPERTPDAAGDARAMSDEDPAEVCSAFVQRYGVEADAFVDLFLSGSPDSRGLAARFGATPAEVQRVLDSIASARIYEAFASTPVAPSEPAPAAIPGRTLTVVARVTQEADGGMPMLSVADGDIYAQTYRIGPAGIEALFRLADEPKQAEQLLSRLRLINQRKSLLYRVLSAVFEHQFGYFATGDVNRLRPLGQAELARRVSEHPSTICRLLRHRAIRYRGEDRPMRWYFQRKQEVIARVVRVHPEASDRDVARLLDERYGCKISRRTVNYHRQQAARTPIVS